MCVRFVLLASGAAFDIFADIGSEARPPKFGGDKLSGFEVSGMSGSFMIVASCKNGMADGVIIWDVDLAFVGKDSGFMLPVREAEAEGEGDGTVHGLEGLEYEGVIGGGGLNAIGEGGIDDANKKRGRKQGDPFVVKVGRGEEIRTAGECVWSCKEFSRDMNHFQIEI